MARENDEVMKPIKNPLQSTFHSGNDGCLNMNWSITDSLNTRGRIPFCYSHIQAHCQTSRVIRSINMENKVTLNE